MRDVLYLAWRHLAYHRWTTALLIAAITVTLFLPLALELVLDRSSERLRARAEVTPLLLGAPGSPLDLVMNALYFSGTPPREAAFADATAVTATGLATGIPIVLGSRVGDRPVVGTTPDYFGFRELAVAEGRTLAISGEAVLGAAAARVLDAEPGDSLVTSPETVFDVTGAYPVRLNIVGVLAPSASPDDEAVFVDVPTTWIIRGIGHGHDDLQDPGSADAVLKRDGDNVVANASVVEYREITPENLSRFHFHGETDSFPVSAVIADPVDDKSGVLLEGRYAEPGATLQAVRPTGVMDELLATVLTVRQYVLAAILLVAAATLAMIVLVFLLSLRLRRAEVATMNRIGAAPGRVAAILGTEVLIVLGVSVILALLMTGAAAAWGDTVFRWLLLRDGG